MTDCISKNNSFILNRLILLSSYIPNPTFVDETLNDNVQQDFDAYWADEKPLASSDIQALKICFEYGILAYFYPAEYTLVNPVVFTDSFILINFILHWYFHDYIGYYVEILLIYYIQKGNNEHKELFLSAFLNFQKMYHTFFFPNKKITQYSSLTTQLVFKKTNLLRLIRVILPCFQSAFWENLSPRQRFVFSSNLIALTIEKGTYKYLNAFFDNNTITFTENSVVIDGETIYFIPLNLETNMEVVGIYTINKEKQLLIPTHENLKEKNSFFLFSKKFLGYVFLGTVVGFTFMFRPRTNPNNIKYYTEPSLVTMVTRATDSLVKEISKPAVPFAMFTGTSSSLSQKDYFASQKVDPTKSVRTNFSRNRVVQSDALMFPGIKHQFKTVFLFNYKDEFDIGAQTAFSNQQSGAQRVLLLGQNYPGEPLTQLTNFKTFMRLEDVVVGKDKETNKIMTEKMLVLYTGDGERFFQDVLYKQRFTKTYFSPEQSKERAYYLNEPLPTDPQGIKLFSKNTAFIFCDLQYKAGTSLDMPVNHDDNAVLPTILNRAFGDLEKFVDYHNFHHGDLPKEIRGTAFFKAFDKYRRSDKPRDQFFRPERHESCHLMGKALGATFRLDYATSGTMFSNAVVNSTNGADNPHVSLLNYKNSSSLKEAVSKCEPVLRCQLNQAIVEYMKKNPNGNWFAYLHCRDKVTDFTIECRDFEVYQYCDKTDFDYESEKKTSLDVDSTYKRVFQKYVLYQHMSDSTQEQLTAIKARIKRNVDRLCADSFVVIVDENNNETLTVNQFEVLKTNSPLAEQLKKQRFRLANNIQKDIQIITTLAETHHGICKTLFLLDSVINERANWRTYLPYVEELCTSSSTSGLALLSVKDTDREYIYNNLLQKGNQFSSITTALSVELTQMKQALKLAAAKADKIQSKTESQASVNNFTTFFNQTNAILNNLEDIRNSPLLTPKTKTYHAQQKLEYNFCESPTANSKILNIFTSIQPAEVEYWLNQLFLEPYFENIVNQVQLLCAHGVSRDNNRTNTMDGAHYRAPDGNIICADVSGASTSQIGLLPSTSQIGLLPSTSQQVSAFNKLNLSSSRSPNQQSPIPTLLNTAYQGSASNNPDFNDSKPKTKSLNQGNLSPKRNRNVSK